MKLTRENFNEQYPDFKGLEIPEEIFHDASLKAVERVYLALLRKYPKYDADRIILLDISQRKLSEMKTNLQNRGYIELKIENAELAKKITIENSHKGHKCEWCGKECYVLHKHHFPISAKDGGTETVDICPNCHYTFHSIVG